MKVILLGAQGSGKSTQAKLLAKKQNVPCIEMGQLFRDKSGDSNPDAIEIKRALDKGELVPDDIAIKFLHERLKKSDVLSGYVLDGYPRNYAQLEGLDQDIDKVIYIKVSDEECIKRSIDRARFDDNLTVLTKRLALYHQKTEPLLDYFRQKGILEEVDGERTIEEIEMDIKERIIDAKHKVSSYQK